MKNITKYCLSASSRQNGALSIFHLYGPEEALAADLDFRLAGKSGLAAAPLEVNELRYGWLRDGDKNGDGDGAVLDEVMLGRPAAELRVLTGHGGRAVRETMERYFRRCGYEPVRIDRAEGESPFLKNDAVVDALLSSCLTEAQAAAVLSARNGAAADPALLVAHRVVLAGAPNAGKSSLLNALSGYERAFVDDRAGATRDVVDELVDLGGYAVWVGDLPGFDKGDDPLARLAWERARERLRTAEWIWFVVDASAGWDEAAAAAEQIDGDANVLVILNKSDLAPTLRLTGDPWRGRFPGAPVAAVSSLPGGDAYEVLSKLAGRLFGGS